MVLYVWPGGSDAWTGRLATPNADRSDGPLHSLEAARDALRQLRCNGAMDGGATVVLCGGVHVRDRSFELTAEDSGQADAPIVYRAEAGQGVVLMGGREVSNWTRVTDPAVRSRLSKAAGDQVLVADLKALGISDYGELKSRGFARATVSSGLELFFDDRPMTLARWPNDGFVTIAGTPAQGATKDEHGGDMGKLEEGFLYEGDRPRRWKDVSNLWVHGYWAYDWANSYERVELIDPDKRLIKTAAPHGIYGFRTGQRFYFLNVLEELDSPGEWYLDAAAGLLYFWPPAPVASAKAFVSVVKEPLIRADDASYIDISGLTFQCGRDKAMEIRGGQGLRVSDCTINNMGSDAVVIQGGREHQVAGCEIYDVGDAGIRAWGGDRKTLAPAGHAIDGNHLHRIGRWSRCYVPPIEIGGVGIRATHNLIHDLPHCGILFSGNDHLIEFNEIHHIAQETGDVGAIYTGRNWSFQGNVIRYNYIHHMRGLGLGANAVYLDDLTSGTVVYGNVFYKVQLAVHIGGGRHNIVENNVFVDCDHAIGMDNRGAMKMQVWQDMVFKTMRHSLEEVDYTHPPYASRYPQLLELEPYYAGGEGIPPEGNKLIRNICVGNWVREEPGPAWLELRDNLTQEDPLFVNAAGGDFRLRPQSPALRLGFVAIPIEQIGPGR
jgi:hypothetical protein